MENEELKKEEAEPADVICGDCHGELLQIEHKEQKVKLFTPKYFMKWFYHCNACGKQTKVFTSRIQKK